MHRHRNINSNKVNSAQLMFKTLFTSSINPKKELNSPMLDVLHRGDVSILQKIEHFDELLVMYTHKPEFNGLGSCLSMLCA